MSVAVASVLVPLAIKKAKNMYGDCLRSEKPVRCVAKLWADRSIGVRVITKRERPATAAAYIMDKNLEELGLTEDDLKGVGKLVKERATGVEKSSVQFAKKI